MALTKAIGLEWEAYVSFSRNRWLDWVAWFFYLVIGAIRERPKNRPSRIAILYVLAFVAGSSALTALGRVQFPMEVALTSRYVTPSLLFWACLFALAVSASATGRPSSSLVRRYRLRVAALFAAWFVGGLVQLPKAAYAVESERFLSEGEHALINGVFAAEGWQRFYRSPGAMIPVVRHFRDRRLASFSREWTRWIDDPAPAHFQVMSEDLDCIGAWESLDPAGGSFSPAVIATGWGYDRRFRRAPERIVFVDAARRIVGFAAVTRRRPDLLPGYPEISSDRVGWVSFLPAARRRTLPPISCSVTVAVCAGRAMRIRGRYLTAEAAKAGDAITGVDVSAQGPWVRDLPAPRLQALRSRLIPGAHMRCTCGPAYFGWVP